MREILVSKIEESIEKMLIEANYFLEKDVEEALLKAEKTEEKEHAKSVLDQLIKNLEIAKEEMIPICQDTGMAIIFLEIGQDVHFTGGFLMDSINKGVKKAYDKGYLRKSVVEDPINRINTKDNSPAIVHTEIVPGDKVTITVTAKGFGSENMSKIFMLKPADGIEGVKEAIINTAKEAGPNACPPFVIGVGIGGDFELAAIMAKKALTREIGSKSTNPYRQLYVDELEEELLEKINEIGLGPAGLGGKNTAFAVNIETYPTHIASLPLAINICCHVNRHKKIVI